MSTPKPTSPFRRDPELEQELNVHLDSLRELGPEYTDGVADAFLQRVEQLIDQRVDERLSGASGRSAARRTSGGGSSVDHHGRKGERPGPGLLVGLAAISIPMLAIAGGIAHLAGIVAVCAVLLVFGLLILRRIE